MTISSTIFNGILVGASGYGLYCITPTEKPYAYSACAISLCHGLLGLISSMQGDGECTKVKEISTSMMEIVTLPLVNIELYLGSSSSSIALGHGLFIIPLAFDLIAKLFTEEGEDSSTETLKDLTILGNVVSLIFLSVNEGDAMFGAMAATAFLTKYGSVIMESIFEGSGENTVLFGQAIFIILTSEVCGTGKAA